MRQRKLDKYVQQLRRIYGEKRRALAEAVAEYFGSEARILGDESGLHLILQMPGKHFDESFISDSQEQGLRVYPIEHYCVTKGEHTDKLMLGYGHLNMDQIRENVMRLHEFLLRKIC